MDRRGDPTLNHKSVSYLRQYARLGRGTVFVNEAGERCEVANGNLFFLVGDVVVTPPLEAPCLPGIIRSVLAPSCGSPRDGKREAAKPLRVPVLPIPFPGPVRRPPPPAPRAFPASFLAPARACLA